MLPGFSHEVFFGGVMSPQVTNRPRVLTNPPKKTSAVTLLVFQHVWGSVLITFMPTKLNTNIDDDYTTKFSYINVNTSAIESTLLWGDEHF